MLDIQPQASIGATQESNGQSTGSPDAISIDFTNFSPGIAPDLSTYGMAFSRLSAATVQTSISTVLSSGIGNHVARIGDNGVNKGFVLEETRTNLPLYSRDLGNGVWIGAPISQSNVTAPDGANTACRLFVGQTSIGHYQTSIAGGLGSPGYPYVGSMWAKAHVSGTYNFNGMYYSVGANTYTIDGAIPATWARYAVTGSSTTTPFLFNISDGRAIAGVNGTLIDRTHDTDNDFIQLEQGKFPTEAIITTATAATRAGERLSFNHIESTLTNGRISPEFVFQPKGNRADYTSNISLLSHPLLSASINPSTGIISVTSSVDNHIQSTTTGITWNAGDTVKLFMDVGQGRASKIQSKINSSATTNYALTGSNLGNLMPYSEDFTNVAWGAYNAVMAVASASITNPFGGSSYVMLEDVSLNFHRVSQGISGYSTGETFRCSVYLKAGTRTWAWIQADSANLYGYVDLVNGVSYAPSITMKDAGNGWWRVTMTYVAGQAASSFYLYPATGNNGVTYQGTSGMEAMYIWGAHVTKGSWATDYVKTVATAIINGQQVTSINTLSAMTGSMDLLCCGTSNQLTSYVNKIAWHRNGSKAQWAV